MNVEIWQEGTLLRSIHFAQLQQESEALTETPFRPEMVRSQVSGKGKREQLQKLSGFPVEPATCEGGCILNRDQCYASNCSELDFCEDCEWEYQQCIDACQPPPPPPTCQYKEVYYWTGFYVVSRTPLWWDQICFHDHISSVYDSRWHVRVETTYRRDYIKKTTYGNCSTSQQVINYEYGYSWCYGWTNSACYGSLHPFNLC
ncbi:MAG TPA: hypothetical protein VLQ45_34030 [Thermoanaerobaculia bacterium]|nr:hypothetical protein [Thermoanaerobaculia bacterium]